MTAVAAPLTRRRFTVTEYHRMAEAGILREDDRVELLDGEVVEMTPIGPRHAGRVKRLNRIFSARVGDRAIVSVQDPIVLGTHWEPEPDVVLLRPRPDFYGSAHPRPEDVLLVVEVAETSLERDREIKLPAYAAAAIPEVWILNLLEDGLDVYRDPASDGYGKVRRLERGGRVAPLALPDLELSVEEILG